MFRHSLVNNIRKLNKYNRIIKRFEHNNNNNADIQKIVSELDHIKKNIQGIRTDNNAYNRKIVDELDDIKKNIQGSRKDNDIASKNIENNALDIFMILTGITGYCIAIIILI